MNLKIVLPAMMVLVSGLLIGCPTTEGPASDITTTDPGSTEAPPVAVHDDTSTNDTGTTTGDSPTTDPGDGTTTTTGDTTIPDPGDTPADPPPSDPNAGSDPGTTEPPSSAISGTFTGTLTWDNSQFLAGGTPFPSGSEDAPMTIEFDDDGVVKAVYFRGFVDAPDGTAEVQQVDDKVTITNNGITQTVRVLQTDYAKDSIFIRIRVRHELLEGQRTENGRGFQEINIGLSGDQLTYEATMTYEVTLSTTSGGPSIDAGEISTTSGTLQRE